MPKGLRHCGVHCGRETSRFGWLGGLAIFLFVWDEVGSWVAPHATVDGDVVTLYQVWKFDYRNFRTAGWLRLQVTFVRERFLNYVRAINGLRETPRWCHAIMNNCNPPAETVGLPDARQQWEPAALCTWHH